MSKTIQEIVDTEDYGTLDHSEILLLIEYKCEEAVKDALHKERSLASLQRGFDETKALQDECDSKLASFLAIEPPVFQVVKFDE